jgi:anti-sigma B factor antagonist
MDYPVKKEVKGEVLVLEAPQKLDTHASEFFRKQLAQLVKSGNFKLVIDLKKTTYINSTGLGAIVSQIATCRSNSGDVRLANTPDSILSLLDITHLNKVLKSFDSVKLAVKSYIE